MHTCDKLNDDFMAIRKILNSDQGHFLNLIVRCVFKRNFRAHFR